jgi:hypothetical protein
MATERLRMRHVREIFRQKLVVGRSNGQVAASVGISNGAVSGAAGRARALGLDWAQITALSDDALEERLYGPRTTKRAGHPLLDPAFHHLELRRAGVTLQLLHPARGTRGRSSRCDRSIARARSSSSTTRANKPRIVDPQTGE